MIQEAIQAIEQMALASANIQTIRLDRDPPEISYLHNRKTGQLTKMVAEVKPRDYSAKTMQEFAAMVLHFKAKQAADASAVVFIDHEGMIAILNENGRRDEFLGLCCKKSEPFDRIEEIARSPRDFSQRELVWQLRTTFANLRTEPVDLLGQVRHIKFLSNAGGESQIKHGRESISNAVLSEVQGIDAEAFPETVMFRVPVFCDTYSDTGEPFEAEIECALNLNPDTQKFTIKPLPGEVEAAERAAMEWMKNVMKRLLGSAAEVFIGTAE